LVYVRMFITSLNDVFTFNCFNGSTNIPYCLSNLDFTSLWEKKNKPVREHISQYILFYLFWYILTVHQNLWSLFFFALLNSFWVSCCCLGCFSFFRDSSLLDIFSSSYIIPLRRVIDFIVAFGFSLGLDGRCLCWRVKKIAYCATGISINFPYMVSYSILALMSFTYLVICSSFPFGVKMNSFWLEMNVQFSPIRSHLFLFVPNLLHISSNVLKMHQKLKSK
jgi:hypothetical protein